jgi:hypothetical protein
MTIDFTCQKCESNFEIEAQDLIDGTEKLICPECEAKAPATVVDDFAAALTELRSQVAALSKKFSVNIAIETEEVEDELEASEEDEDKDYEEDDEEDDEPEDDEDM